MDDMMTVHQTAAKKRPRNVVYDNGSSDSHRVMALFEERSRAEDQMWHRGSNTIVISGAD